MWSDPKNKYKHRRMRLVNAKAKELMLSGENHLVLIFALIVIGVMAVFPELLLSMIYGFIVYPYADIAMAVLGFFLISPLFYGLLYMVSNMADGERCDLHELFDAFASARRFLRSISLGLALLLTAAISVLLIALPIAASEWLEEAGAPQWLAALEGIVGTVMASAVVLLLTCRMSLFPMLAVKEEGVFRAIARSFVLTKGKTFKLVRYALGFLPLVIVSILAVLVPMLIYTAPYMLCAYAIGVKMICENNE